MDFLARSFVLFGFLFECFTENLTGPLHALLIGVGVHPQRYRLVAVSQLLRYAGNIRAVGDGDAGEGMSEGMGMEAGNTATLGELLQIPGWALGVHRLRAGLLSEYP